MLIPNAATVWLKLRSVQVAAAFAILGVAWLLLAPVRALIPFGTLVSLFVVGFICVIVARLWKQPSISALGTAVVDVTEEVYAEGKSEVSSLRTKTPVVDAPPAAISELNPPVSGGAP